MKNRRETIAGGVERIALGSAEDELEIEVDYGI
jgi:hypothetical protein